MNRIPGELGGHGTVKVLGATVPIQSRGPESPDGAVDVLVRPERLAVEAAEGGNGIVTGRNFLGSVTRVTVLLSGDTSVQAPANVVAAVPPVGSLRRPPLTIAYQSDITLICGQCGRTPKATGGIPCTHRMTTPLPRHGRPPRG
jgi:hypothetical protein